MRLFLFGLAACLVMAGLSRHGVGQWVGGRCATVGVPAAVKYEWKTEECYAGWIYLTANGWPVGAFNYNDRQYYPYDPQRKTWGQPQDCAPVGIAEQPRHGATPKKMPGGCKCGCGSCSGKCGCADGACAEGCGCQAKAPLIEQLVIPPHEMLPGENLVEGQSNFGINTEEVRKACSLCRCIDCQCAGGPDGCACHDTYFDERGCPLTKAQAFAKIGAILPNDADCLRLTLIGSADDARKMRADLADAPALALWKDRLCVQDYRSAEEPILKGLGFTAGVEVQSPEGWPLWYANGYTDAGSLAKGLQTAEELRQAVTAVRQKDPNWQPAQWPPLFEPARPAMPATPANPAPDPSSNGTMDWCKRNWGYLAGAAAAFAFFWRRKQEA